MSLDEYFRIGETITLGAHTFEADEIKAFAAKYDPQRFHMDERDAEKSVFGRLCASGWHTAATWMKYNVRTGKNFAGQTWKGPGPRPGETVTFTRRALGHRALASRPGWVIVNMACEGFDSTGDKVIEFENNVLVKIE